jgi:ectoine hydroxylase-related dioxygenase (phytanoyl-CoA dioxygenase family)
MLDADQIEHFRREGYVVMRNAVAPATLKLLTDEVDRWVEESRGHDKNYGETCNGKARFDLEAGHSAAAPRLRRVSNPVDISESYRQVLWDGPIPDMVVDLIGPNVKFHHCKLNTKLPGMDTYVGYHQDHPFDPHTNDDVVVALLLLDDMTLDNGCLLVVPGSHRERYSHYRGDTFVGEIAAEHHADFERRAQPIVGRAGDVCLQSTWMVHGGGPNRTDRPRRMLICDYTAADNFWLMPPIVPSPHSGRIVRGAATRMVRLSGGVKELPQHYAHDSFFAAQGQKTADGKRSAAMGM